MKHVQVEWCSLCNKSDPLFTPYQVDSLTQFLNTSKEEMGNHWILVQQLKSPWLSLYFTRETTGYIGCNGQQHVPTNVGVQTSCKVTKGTDHHPVGKSWNPSDKRQSVYVLNDHKVFNIGVLLQWMQQHSNCTLIDR